jgi:integrase
VSRFVVAFSESGETPGRALTPEESLRLFATAESKDEWLVAYLAAVVANDRGVELRNLKLGDVDSDARKIAIRRSKRVGRRALEQVASVAKPDTILAGIVSRSLASSIAPSTGRTRDVPG